MLYNPIGLVDNRFTRPWQDTDEGYRQNLVATWQTTRGGIGRYVAHNPAAWNDEFEKYTRIRYAWTLSAEWAAVHHCHAIGKIPDTLAADRDVGTAPEIGHVPIVV